MTDGTTAEDSPEGPAPYELFSTERFARCVRTPRLWLSSLAGWATVTAIFLTMVPASPFVWHVPQNRAGWLMVIAFSMLGVNGGATLDVVWGDPEPGRRSAIGKLVGGCFILATATLYTGLAMAWHQPGPAKGFTDASALTPIAMTLSGVCVLLAWLLELRELRASAGA